MGQKINPIIFRLGVNRTWNSSWYAGKKQFGTYLYKDIKIKDIIRKVLKNAGVASIHIERSLNNVMVNIFSSKPGVIIGKKGDNIDKIKQLLESTFGETFMINIKEVTQPDLSAVLAGENVAGQIERRMPYRRAVKSVIEKVMQAGAQGVKIRIGGRLNGAEIARREFFKAGNIPLHTLRADVDYAKIEANTTYGVIGIQVWVYRGLKFDA